MGAAMTPPSWDDPAHSSMTLRVRISILHQDLRLTFTHLLVYMVKASCLEENILLFKSKDCS